MDVGKVWRPWKWFPGVLCAFKTSFWSEMLGAGAQELRVQGSGSGLRGLRQIKGQRSRRLKPGQGLGA